MTRQAEPQWLNYAAKAMVEDHPFEIGLDDARQLIRVALPWIEFGMREKIATELEAASTADDREDRTQAFQWIAVGIRQAATIVRGDQ